MSTPTLLLTRSDVAALASPERLLGRLRAAHANYSLERDGADGQRARASLPGGCSAMVLFPGRVDGVGAYTVKVHAKFPGRDPAICGVIHLHDLHTGALLAVIDSPLLTAIRTAVVGALAADVLARPDAETVAVVGAGAVARRQVELLPLVRAPRRVRVYDVDAAAADRFVAALSPSSPAVFERVASVEAAVGGADLIITATWSRQPFLFLPMVAQGAHITTLGPDEPGKCEVDAALLRHGLFVCDDRHLAMTMGAAGGAGIAAEDIAAELGEVIAGVHPGRTSAQQITVFGGVGLPMQDLVAAWDVYEAARAQRVGTPFSFGA